MERLRLHEEYVNGLYERRNVLNEELNQALEDRADDPDDEEIGERIAKLQEDITGLNTQISQAQAAAPTLTGFDGQSTGLNPTPEEDFSALNVGDNGLSSVLGALPEDFRNAAIAQMTNPSLPVTKQMDNYITVLWERLSRMLATQQDDLLRNPGQVAYLLEFNTGLIASKKGSKRLARVQYTLSGTSGSQAISRPEQLRSYSLYPGQSAYNINDYYGKSQRTGIIGFVQTLLGFGLRAEYQRQRDELRSSLVQSVYAAGFGTGDRQFGWYFGPDPFQKKVTAGNRVTYAIVTVPENTQCLNIDYEHSWVKKSNPRPDRRDTLPGGSFSIALPHADGLETASCLAKSPEASQPANKKEETALGGPSPGNGTNGDNSSPHLANGTNGHGTNGSNPNDVTSNKVAQTVAEDSDPCPLNGNRRQHNGHTTVERLEYNTVYFAQGSDPEPSLVLLELDRPIDPNIVITVRGEPLRRVRDWRGRATNSSPPFSLTNGNGNGNGNGSNLQKLRGLLETDDVDAAGTWMAVSSQRLLLRISYQQAGLTDFPSIQLLDPSGSLLIPNDLRTPETEIIHQGLGYKHHFKREGEKWEAFRDYFISQLPVEQEEHREVLREAFQIVLCNGEEFPFLPVHFFPLFAQHPAGGPDSARFTAKVNPDFSITVQAESEDSLWLAGRTRVVLEDSERSWPFPLSCEVFEDRLLCRLPRQVEQLYESLLGLRGMPSYNIGIAAVENASSPEEKLGNASAYIQQSDMHSRTPARALMTALQVSVVQTDPKGEHTFSSASPIRLNPSPLPLLAANFQEWSFHDANAEAFRINGCGYVKQCSKPEIRLIGFPDPQEIEQRCPPKNGGDRSECICFEVPNQALKGDSLLFEIKGSRAATFHLPTSLLKPRFGDASVAAKRDPSSGIILHWSVEVPAERLFAEDQVAEVSEASQAGSGEGSYEILVDEKKIKFEIPKEALHRFPSGPLALRRNDEELATLPDIRQNLLPGELTLVARGARAFQLSGKNAGAIDRVLLVEKGEVKADQIPTSGHQLAIAEFDASLKAGEYSVFYRVGQVLAPAQGPAGAAVTFKVAGAKASGSSNVPGFAVKTSIASLTPDAKAFTATLNVTFSKVGKKAFEKALFEVNGADAEVLNSAGQPLPRNEQGMWEVSQPATLRLNLSNLRQGRNIVISAKNEESASHPSVEIQVL